MPQLVKGGKWVFGWCMVGQTNDIRIPAEAYSEYGFQPGETVILIRGSQRSGGFGLGKPAKLEHFSVKSRFIGQTIMGADERVVLPSEAGLQPGDRLLAVRGSGLALGFVQRGPIYEEALNHPEIETFVAH